MSKSWQELYNQTKPLLDKYYPHYQSAKDYAKIFLKRQVKKGDIVLDLGCGWHSEDLAPIKDRIKLIGIDFEKESGRKNKLLDEFKQADLNKKLPLPGNTFDLVYSRFVIEHIKEPEKLYAEVYRLLKPGGIFINIVPNLYNPIIFLNKIMPLAWQKRIKAGLTGIKEEDVFPTYYHSNTAGKIKKQLKQAGFSDIEIARRGGVFEYFMKSKILFFLAIIYERITDYAAKFKKLHLIIISKK